MLSETGSGISKGHVVVLSVVVLVASASAAVNVRDPMNVFGDLNMQNNVIQNPQDIKFEGGTVTKQVDINTDGKFNYSDAVALAFAKQENKVDFNRDGEKDFDDVIAMAYAIGSQRSFDPDTGEATFPKYNSLGRFNSLSTALSWYTLNPNVGDRQTPKNVSIRSNLDMQNKLINNPKDIKFEGDGTVTKEVDIDKDGDFDFDDTVDLAFENTEEPPGENSLDFNRDGEKDFDDAIAMEFARGTQKSFDPDTGEATFPKYNSLGRFNSLSTALSWYTLNPNINEQGPKNVSIRSDLDLQGNNIYNVGNLNGGTGGTTGGGGLTIPPYNDISSSRQLVSPTDSGPTYTNNHNGPRLVTVITKSGNAGGRADAFVNGNLVASFGSDESASEGFQTLSFFVPQGANYQVNGVQDFLTLEAWYEQDLQGGSGGGGGSLSGSPVFGSVSYTKMGETSEFVTPRYDYEKVKTLSTGESVSVSRTAQLGGTTKFRVLGGIVNRDTDGPPPSGRHFGDAIQRDLGYVQLLVDGEVVSEAQELNEWSAGTRMPTSLWIGTVNNRREPVMTTDPISVETGDTVTARVAADQEVDTDEVGSGGVGSFYQYVVLKRVDK